MYTHFIIRTMKMKKEHMRTFLKQTENAEKVLLSPFMIMQVYLYYMQNMC